MSRILLDTSGYSALLRGDARVLSRIQEADVIVVTPIVLGELKAGFSMGKHKEKNRRELSRFLQSPRVAVLPLDEETSERWAVIVSSLRRVGTPIPTNDLWIAASAMQHGVAVLTMDSHFEKVPQIIAEVCSARTDL